MMDVRFLTSTAVEDHSVANLKALLDREDGFVWIDIPSWDDEAAEVLTGIFAVHPMALTACAERNHVPTVHGYPNHVFVIVHSPLIGVAGHVHLLELDQFVGSRHLITVHGPVNPAVPPESPLEETRATLDRVRAGRFHPGSPAELSHGIVSAIVRRQRSVIGAAAQRVAVMEQTVMAGNLADPERLLEDLFLLRHELLTVRTMALHTHEIYARIASHARIVPPEDRPFAEDLADQFDRVCRIGDGEKEFLYGVIDLYQTRVTTKMTVAMERLAVLAAVTLPVTAIASVYGMNVIVNSRTHVVQLVLVLILMVVISGMLLRWTKRQGWW